MDAGAATFALLIVAMGTVTPQGETRVSAIVDAPIGAIVPDTQLGGCPATAIGSTMRAHVAWSIAFDPAYASRERFRDGRQMALYFVSHIEEGDTMNVAVQGHDPSGFHGLAELTQLRAAIDAVVDPAPPNLPPRAAGELLSLARADAARARIPAEEPALALGVSIEDANGETLVRVAGETVDLRQSFPEGTAQARGPRWITEVGARVSRVSTATFVSRCFHARGATSSERAEPREAPPPTRSLRGISTIAGGPFGKIFAIVAAAMILALVWRRVRRG